MARAFDPENLDPDRQLLKKFDEAWLTDLALIRELTLQEKQAEEDRAFAARLAGIQLNAVSDDDRRMAMLLDDFDDEINNDREETCTTNNTSTVHRTTNTNNQSKSKKCAACMDFVTKKDPCTPCGHTYCVGCLKELFVTSMRDETLMPPRCCGQEIPITLVRLTPKEIENFTAKLLEHSTLDRLYCSKPTCSAFIPPARIVNSIGTCPKSNCGVTTCAICKAASHGNRDCPKDEATAAVLAAASKAGWPRCYRCRALVELTQGCYHMTCRCRAEFCYLCSTPWKNCTCVQWDEQRLLQEARIRSARIPVHQARQADGRIDLNQGVEQMVNQLRANHECRHTDGWIYSRGGGRCDECHDYLSLYLYRCRQCQFMACNRCRHNRL